MSKVSYIYLGGFSLMNERKITVANPTPLGLLGLGLVTMVASSSKLGFTTGVSFLIPWVVFLGATAQLIACIMDFKKDNMFGATAFGGYALFWYSMAMAWMIGAGVFGETLASSVDPKQMGFAFIGYLIFSVFMTIGSLTTNKVLFTVFFLIDFLFIGLICTTFHVFAEFGHSLAAYSEIIISLVSLYGSGAIIVNGSFGREVFPIGKAIYNPKKAKLRKVA
jgi:succinate-acetate transporter protein